MTYIPASASALTVARLAADVGPRTLDTLADVTGLSFAVAANTDYAFHFDVLLQSASTAGGARLGLTCPAGATISYATEIPADSATSKADHEMPGTSSGALTQATNLYAANVPLVARMNGILRVGATAGTLQLQYGTQLAGIGVTVKAGSAGQLYTLT